MDFKVKHYQNRNRSKITGPSQHINTVALRSYWRYQLNISKYFIAIHCTGEVSPEIPASFNNKFEQISINSIIEATKFKPETTFEKNIDDAKANNVKSRTSIGMNPSAITSVYPLFYEYPNAYLVLWIVLQSLSKAPQFTNICLPCTFK